MAVHRVVEDFETRLSSPTGSARGKAEWERYGNGEIRFDIWVKGLEVPDGTVVEVVSDTATVGSFQVKRGRGRLVIDNPTFRPEPEQPMILAAGAILMSGEWEAD